MPYISQEELDLLRLSVSNVRRSYEILGQVIDDIQEGPVMPPMQPVDGLARLVP